MITATAKMIYSDKGIAEAILGKLIENSPDSKYDLFKLPVGWQIVRVKKLPDFMPPAKPLPVKKTADAKSAAHLAACGGNPGAVTFGVKVERETPHWVYFKEPVGPLGAKWLHKSHIISQADLDGVTQFVVTSKIAAEKLGL